MAVNLLGDKLGALAPGALDAGAGPRGSAAYAPGHGGRTGAGRGSRNELNDLSFDMNFDPETAQRIRNIAAAKDEAVRSEVSCRNFRFISLYLFMHIWLLEHNCGDTRPKTPI